MLSYTNSYCPLFWSNPKDSLKKIVIACQKKTMGNYENSPTKMGTINLWLLFQNDVTLNSNLEKCLFERVKISCLVIVSRFTQLYHHTLQIQSFHHITSFLIYSFRTIFLSHASIISILFIAWNVSKRSQVGNVIFRQKHFVFEKEGWRRSLSTI